MVETLALELAAWSAHIGWNDVPEDLRPLVRLRVLDHVGLNLAALDGAPAHAVLEIATRQGGAAEAGVIGSATRLPASWAALVHGTISHCRDFDDTFADSVVHPGSVVVPTALAVGEATGAAGADVLAAIVAGYEVSARLGAAAGRGLHARGFHASGVIGPLAGATTAARLYGLDARATAEAMGLAGSMAGGLMEFVTDGAWSKWLHTGWSTHGGILAAQLAGAGFLGPVSVLEGGQGLYASFLGEGVAALEGIAVALGEVWHGAEAEFKYYPCAHVIQPYIDAALALRAEHGLPVGEIEEVVCAIAPWCVPIVCEPRAIKLRPENSLQAIASLPFQVAAALTDGEATLETLEPASLAREPVLALTARVRHQVDDSLGAGFDGRITVKTRDGAMHEAAAVLARADAAKVRAKFHRNAARALPADRAAKIEAAVDAADFDVAALMDLLVA